MTQDEASRRMAADDLFFAPLLIAMGVWSIQDGHRFLGGLFVVVGGLWLFTRLRFLFRKPPDADGGSEP